MRRLKRARTRKMECRQPEVVRKALGLPAGADVFKGMSRFAYEKRERVARWLFIRFLKDENSPKGWEDLMQRQKNYWRGLADEALKVIK